jgi:drug/metabolite transporter (DMT)-like permease
MALAAAAGWGLQYAVTENMLKGMKVSNWLTFYFCGGAICCLLYNLALTRRIPLPLKSEIFPIALCIAVGLFAQSCINGAILSKNATQASLLENAVPLFAFLFSGLLFGNWELNGRTFVGAALMMTGIVVIGSR